MHLTDAASPRRRKIRHSRVDERDDNDTDLKRKATRGTWEGIHQCIAHHHCDNKRKALVGETTDCSDTEPENDISFSSDDASEDSLLGDVEHVGIYNAIHVRRSNFLKPSSGDVEIIPMPKPDEAMGHVIESEASSTTCSEQLEEERAPPDMDSECEGVSLSSSFTWFRINYVLVMSAIMLADGLQGKVSRNRYSMVSNGIRKIMFVSLILLLLSHFIRDSFICPL